MEKEKNTLVAGLEDLAAVFDERPLTARKVEIYRSVFKDADRVVFQHACIEAIKTSRSFPKPVELRALMAVVSTTR